LAFDLRCRSEVVAHRCHLGIVMLSIEEFIALTEECSTVSELGQLLHKAMQEEGFENLSFCRVHNGRKIVQPWLFLPDGFVETYYQSDFFKNDPIVARMPLARGPVYWSDLELRGRLTKAERKMVADCRELGVRDGVSFPFHGPDGLCDLIGVSRRNKGEPDRSRTGIIQAKINHARWRYWYLQNTGNMLARDANTRIHLGGPRGMTANHCRALVFTSVAARRWEMGLIDLNSHLLNFVRTRELEDLLKWGLVSERPDDDRFEYYYAPTVLGMCHLTGCEQVELFRREAWELDSARREIPSI
jgi:hypothetical protein